MKTHLMFHSSDVGGGAPAPAATGTPSPSAPAATGASTGAPAGAPAGSPPASAAPGTTPAQTPGSAAAGAPTTPTSTSTTPTTPAAPTPVAERAALTAIDSLLRQVQDPAPPKDYSPENFQRYQQEIANAQAWRNFQQSVRDVVAKPTMFADGVQHVFTSPEEVQEFGAFARDITSGKIPITGKDLLMLFRGKALLQQAHDHGARQYEAGLRRTSTQQTPAAPAQGAPVVPLREPKESAPGGVPSVATILQQKDPAFYAKLMKGEVALT